MPAPTNPPAGVPDSGFEQTSDLLAAGAGPSTTRRGDTSFGSTAAAEEQTGAYVPRDEAPADSSLTGGYTPHVPGTPSAALVVVPGYEMQGVLGRGGMGVVYKARQVALDRVVALKMILAGPHASPAVLARFHSEAQAVARLQHPNIVQIHEVGEVNGLPYFSLELVEGGTLARKTAHEPQAPRYAAQTVEALARAMQYAHERGVVHRDLKPANVLLAADGTPKVTDFGLAKRLEADSGQTQEGSVLGTPSYMAPEQARGEAGRIGPAADIYSLGAMLYDLLTGRPPFSGSSVLDTLEMVRTREPVPPSQLAGRLPKDLETICLKCLQKDPARRYATAGHLADDLRRFLDGRPILARPVSVPERAWRWARRNPLGATVIGVIAVSAVIASVLSWQLYLAKGEADRNARAAEQSAEVATAEKEQAQRERDAKEEARAKEASARIAEAAARKDEAVARKAEAEFLQATLNALRGILMPLDDALRNNARLLPIRRQVLNTALRDVNEVRALLDKRPVPLMGRTEAVAYTRLAEVLLRANQVEDSYALYQKAFAILERLERQDPGDPVAKRNLAAIHNVLGDVEARLGNAPTTRDRYRTALGLRQIWEGMVPGHTPAKHAAAQSHGLVGSIELRLGDPAEALPQFQAAEKQYARLPADYARALTVRRELAALKEDLGRAHFLTGDTGAAERAFRASMGDRDTLATQFAKDATAGPATARDRTLSRLALGDFLLARGDVPAAWAEYDQAFRAFARLLAAEPDNLDARRDLAAAHYRLGATGSRVFGPIAVLARLPEGHFAECLRLRLGLARVDPRDSQAQMELLLALARCGRVGEAERVITDLSKRSADDRRVMFYVACGLAVASTAPDPAAGRCRFRAFEVLTGIIDGGWKDRVSLETEPDLASLRGDKQFTALLDRVPPPRSNGGQSDRKP